MADNIIKKYFPSVSERQIQQFDTLGRTCWEWNEKINVISRKDIDNITINHILHSLAIARYIRFSPGSVVIDLGTGGGFPGLPLAIMFPDVKFHLVDRIGKKLRVAEETAKACGLENVTFQHGDFGECKLPADFVVSRAVMQQPDLAKLVKKNIRKESSNALPNGLITLKGGDLSAELSACGKKGEVVEISDYFDEPFFETKKIVYTPI